MRGPLPANLAYARSSGPEPTEKQSPVQMISNAPQEGQLPSGSGEHPALPGGMGWEGGT